MRWLKKIRDCVITWGSLSIIIFAGGLVAYYHYLLFAPFEHWLDVKQVVPIEQQFRPGEELIFRTEAKVHRHSHIRYLDILFCGDCGEGNTYIYDTFESEGELEPGIINKDWRFDGKVHGQKTCYLKSRFQLQLPWGLTKDITYTGKPFDVNIPE